MWTCKRKEARRPRGLLAWAAPLTFALSLITSKQPLHRPRAPPAVPAYAAMKTRVALVLCLALGAALAPRQAAAAGFSDQQLEATIVRRGSGQGAAATAPPPAVLAPTPRSPACCPPGRLHQVARRHHRRQAACRHPQQAPLTAHLVPRRACGECGWRCAGAGAAGGRAGGCGIEPPPRAPTPLSPTPSRPPPAPYPPLPCRRACRSS